MKHALSLIILLLALPLWADDELDQILDDFDNQPIATAAAPKDSRFKFNGRISLSSSYNHAHKRPLPGQVDYRGLDAVTPELALGLNLELSPAWEFFASGHIMAVDDFEVSQLPSRDYQISRRRKAETEFGDIYLHGELSENLDLTIGRQTLSWGFSDNMRIVDVINPVDLRTPGPRSVFDLKLPLTMSRLDYYWKDLSISAIAIHERRFHKLPEFGSDFYPSSQPLPPENRPDNSLKNTEYALRLSAAIKNWDLALYWADYYDRMPHLAINSFKMTELHYSELSMLGASISAAFGNWLIKGEAAGTGGLEFYNLPGRKKSRYDILAGIEYTGIRNTAISLDLSHSHINDFHPSLERTPDYQQEDQSRLALNVYSSLLHDTLTLDLFINLYGPAASDAALRRFSATYEIIDDLSLKLGLVTFKEGDRFDTLRENDRIFTELSYNF